MTEPLVCAIMLTRDRPHMAARAVRCFGEQTYAHKRLLIWDNGEFNRDFDTCEEGNGLISHVPAEAYRNISIGALRNEAVAFWNYYQIAIHWDDDDVSHPNRIAEQVAILQASGKECVGYREMLFWKVGSGPHDVDPMERSMPALPGEAWLYTDLRPQPTYCLGTSLCYWRSVWEKRPFPEMNNVTGSGRGEDSEWLKGVDSLGINSVCDAPRMIATIHAGNGQHYAGALGSSPNWKRVPQWDEYCRERCAL